MALFPCLEMSFIGIRLRTSRPPNDPELLVPCNSLSMLEKKLQFLLVFLFEDYSATGIKATYPTLLSRAEYLVSDFKYYAI